MQLNLATAILAAAIVWVGTRIVRAIEASREDALQTRTAQLMALLAPGLAACATDPRALLVWQPLAVTVRKAYPREAALLDKAAGGTFPFTPEQLQSAHSQWTADWLAWERAHNGEFKLRVAAAEAELAAGGSPLARAKLDAVESEKLDSYQQRYGEYVRTAKALQNLISPTS